MFRLIAELAQFFAEARHYSRIDPDHLAGSPVEADRLVTSHRRIVAVAAACGLLGAAAGLFLIYMVVTSPEGLAEVQAPRRGGGAVKGAFAVLLAPVLLGVVGLVFGCSLACGFASREFYESPLGRKWLQMVGVEAIGPARFVCLLVAAIIAGVCGTILYFLITGPR